MNRKVVIIIGILVVSILAGIRTDKSPIYEEKEIYLDYIAYNNNTTIRGRDYHNISVISGYEIIVSWYGITFLIQERIIE